MNLTEEISIGSVTYTLKTRLGWYESQQIEQAGFRLYADGKSVSEADDIAAIPLLEIKIDTADANLKRLCMWLVGEGGRGLKPIDAMKIDPAHVPVLLARIEELEAEQAEEVKALSDAHPLMLKRAAKAKAKTATLVADTERSLKE